MEITSCDPVIRSYYVKRKNAVFIKEEIVINTLYMLMLYFIDHCNAVTWQLQVNDKWTF